MTLSSTRCQYLTFALGDETYALEINQAREVVDVTRITLVPGMPKFVRGIINLRENTVPVFDLNLKFGRKGIETKDGTCIVISQIPLGEKSGLIGILADTVHGVRFLDPEPMDSLEKIASRPVSKFIKGIDRQDSNFILVLSLDTLFAPNEILAAATTDHNGGHHVTQ